MHKIFRHSPLLCLRGNQKWITNSSVIRQSEIVGRVRTNALRLMRIPGRVVVRQTTIAKALGLSPSQVGNFLRGHYGLALKHLDPLADVLGVPTSELVRRGELPLFELTESEARLVTYYRQWTPSVRASLMDVFDFLHAKLPDDRQTVEMFDYWGKMEHARRNILYAAAVRLSDEGLSPEVRAALGIQAITGDTVSTKGTKRQRTP